MLELSLICAFPQKSTWTLLVGASEGGIKCCFQFPRSRESLPLLEEVRHPRAGIGSPEGISPACGCPGAVPRPQPVCSAQSWSWDLRSVLAGGELWEKPPCSNAR